MEPQVVRTSKVAPLGNELSPLEIFERDFDTHHAVACLGLRKSSSEFENFHERINRIEIINISTRTPFGIGGPRMRLVSPLAPHREVVDEKTIGMEPPELKNVIRIEGLLDPIWSSLQAFRITDVRIIPPPQSDTISLDDREQVVESDAMLLESTRPDHDDPVTAFSQLLKDRCSLNGAHPMSSICFRNSSSALGESGRTGAMRENRPALCALVTNRLTPLSMAKSSNSRISS